MRFVAMFVLCLSIGCSIPPPSGPLVVRCEDLAKSYRDSPSVADTAYTGQTVCIPCEHCRHDHTRLVWALGADASSPPVVILDFSPLQAPAPVAGLWVTGTCNGRTMDGVRRELPGFTFVVHVSDCRAARAP